MPDRPDLVALTRETHARFNQAVEGLGHIGILDQHRRHDMDGAALRGRRAGDDVEIIEIVLEEPAGGERRLPPGVRG